MKRDVDVQTYAYVHCVYYVCVWLYIYMYLFVSTMIGTYLVSCCLVLLIVRLGDPLTTVNVIASVLLLFSIITDIVSFANETAVILTGYYVQSSVEFCLREADGNLQEAAGYLAIIQASPRHWRLSRNIHHQCLRDTPRHMEGWQVVPGGLIRNGSLRVMCTLWLFNIAMEHGPFIDGLPIKNGDFPWLC